MTSSLSLSYVRPYSHFIQLTFFQVAYQRILQLTYVDDLLNVIRTVFVDMFAPFLKSFLASVHASVGVAAAGVGSLAPQWDFKAQLRDWDATFDKILRSLQDKATQVRISPFPPFVRGSSSPRTGNLAKSLLA
jgi:signal recognition particle receptor subunit alpha